MLMTAPFPGPTLSHYAICLQNAVMMCILDRTVVCFPVMSRPFLFFLFSFYCYFKTPTVYLCGCLRVPERTCAHMHIHPCSQQAHGLQLLGVLQVGSTPVLSLTALLLFKCGRAIRSRH